MGRARDPMVDSMAGNYRLVERIGAGGMGEVYKAVNEQIGSKVAIKLLHATALRDKSLQERFILEAKAVNRIEHPGVVKVIDAGRMESGRPFLVMELLDGHSLHELRKLSKLSISQSCRAIADVLDALSAAHAAGVIHRDLKPANLFRTRDGRTVVLDFGVAKLMASDAPVRLTMTGSAVGTPHYMAPEQIRGQPVTPAVDIYAAGVVLFELVCGRRPFDNTDEDGAMIGHLERRPPPPRAIEPACPTAVQDIILAALQKDPAKRPRSAAAMRDALRAAIAAHPEVRAVAIDAAPVSADDPRSPWARPSDSAPPPLPATPSPGSSNVATIPASPAAKIPRTEPQSTPAGVRAHRQRSSRLRTFALVGAAAFALVGVILVIYAMKRSRADITVSTAAPAPRPVAAAAPDAPVAPDATITLPIGDQPATCAELVNVDPIGVADERHAEVKATFFRRCEEDHWSAAAIACFVSATDASDLTRCLQTLTSDQLHDLQTALEEHRPRRIKKPRGQSPDLEFLPATKDPFARPRPPREEKPAREDPDGLRNPFSEATDARVRIESFPSGAMVKIDGKEVGRTPLVATTPRQTVTIQLELTGYDTQHVSVDARTGHSVTIRMTRKPSTSLPF